MFLCYPSISKLCPQLQLCNLMWLQQEEKALNSLHHQWIQGYGSMSLIWLCWACAVKSKLTSWSTWTLAGASGFVQLQSPGVGWVLPLFVLSPCFPLGCWIQHQEREQWSHCLGSRASSKGCLQQEFVSIIELMEGMWLHLHSTCGSPVEGISNWRNLILIQDREEFV